ncbi:MAG: polymer-forming cytoskeletal protein [Vulcanimicrobiaceae bacterium]
MKHRMLLVLAVALVACAAFARPALAHTQAIDHGGSYIGNVIVRPGQVVDGSLNVVFGDATIAGTVNGDVNVVGGSVIEEPGGVVTGHINTLGKDMARTVVPWLPRAPWNMLNVENLHMLNSLMWDVVVLVFFLIFPLRTKIALERLERHPGLCAAVGLLGWVAVIPLALLLLVTLILIPLIPVEMLAVFVGVLIGKAALALLVGRRLAELVSPSTTTPPLAALVLGLVLLTAAELVPLVGGLVTALIWLVGLGATILAFVQEHIFTGVTGGIATVTPHGPISGPPMTTA